MKSFRYLVIFLLVVLYIMQIGTIVMVASAFPHNETENEIRYEIVERFGNIDTDGTLFIAEDGNLYAVDAQYPTTQGNLFLIKLNGKGTETKTDDEILEVWGGI